MAGPPTATRLPGGQTPEPLQTIPVFCRPINVESPEQGHKPRPCYSGRSWDKVGLAWFIGRKWGVIGVTGIMSCLLSEGRCERYHHWWLTVAYLCLLYHLSILNNVETTNKIIDFVCTFSVLFPFSFTLKCYFVDIPATKLKHFVVGSLRLGPMEWWIMTDLIKLSVCQP